MVARARSAPSVVGFINKLLFLTGSQNTVKNTKRSPFTSELFLHLFVNQILLLGLFRSPLRNLILCGFVWDSSRNCLVIWFSWPFCHIGRNNNTKSIRKCRSRKLIAELGKNLVLPFYIYMYAFSRRFYPKRLTVHSGYSLHFFCQYVCSLGI